MRRAAARTPIVSNSTQHKKANPMNAAVRLKPDSTGFERQYRWRPASAGLSRKDIKVLANNLLQPHEQRAAHQRVANRHFVEVRQLSK